MDVGEVAPSAARDENLPSGLRIVLEKQNAAMALPGDGGAHQSGRTGAQNDYIEFWRFSRHPFIVAECPHEKTVAGAASLLCRLHLLFDRIHAFHSLGEADLLTAAHELDRFHLPAFHQQRLNRRLVAHV